MSASGLDGLAGGLPLAIGIGLQNAPEGLAVAVSLLGEGYSRRRAWGIAALTGLVEPIGGLLGAGIISISQPLLPWGLAFAAGAMLYVISHEIIPETHRSRPSKQGDTRSRSRPRDHVVPRCLAGRMR